MPLWQVVPPLQAVHDDPQCCESLDASTHVPPHEVCPAGQAQVPAWQTCPPVQTWPQVPQFDPSVCRLVHAVPHKSGSAAVGQVHEPPWHTCADGHAVMHAPQCSALVIRFAHVVPHAVSAAAQELVHAYAPPSPSAHSGAAPVQTTPHAPQLVPTEMGFEHPIPASAQSAKPDRHVYVHWPPLHPTVARSTSWSIVQSLPHTLQLWTSLDEPHPASPPPPSSPGEPSLPASVRTSPSPSPAWAAPSCATAGPASLPASCPPPSVVASGRSMPPASTDASSGSSSERS